MTEGDLLLSEIYLTGRLIKNLPVRISEISIKTPDGKSVKIEIKG